MEYVYLDLGGCGMNGMIGKSDDWTKIFGWKHDVSPKIFGLKLEKNLGYLKNYKDLGCGPGAAFGRSPTCIFAPFYTIYTDYGVRLCDISYYQCQNTPFLTDIL